MFDSIDLAPVWAEIDLNKLEDNAREVMRIVNKDSLITGVVKADAYGHGAIIIGKTLLEQGFDKLAVANVREAIELREAGIREDILILGYTEEEDFKKILDYSLIQTIYRYDQAFKLSKLADTNKRKVKIHIKIDTGLSRIGFLNTNQSINDIMKIAELDYIEIEGIFTHLATADSRDKSFARKQVEEYLKLIEKLEKNGLDLGYKHVSNSAAIIDLPEYNFDMVKPGIMQYGLFPSDEVNKNRVDLKPIMELKTRISNLKKIGSGIGISYGQTYITDRNSDIATIPIGYADGISRLLSNKAEFGIGGKRAKVVGNICMDQTMIDVSDISNIEIGDHVTIFGNGEDGSPRVEELASIVGTINYELLTLVGRRIPRVYLRDGKIVKIVDYLLD